MQRLRFLPLAALLLLGACNAGLPPALKRDIAAEADKLAGSRKQVAAAQAALAKDLASDPQLFQQAPQPEQWKSSLHAAADQLDQAQQVDRSLADLVRRNRADSRLQADRLLAEERRLRDSAVSRSHAIQAEADKWLAFKSALPANLAALQRQYQEIHNRSLTPVAAVVQKAEIDWPARKPTLEARLVSLDDIPRTAEKQWTDSEPARRHAAAGTASGADIASLIVTQEALSSDAAGEARASDELRSLSGQLYDSWDKILTDLDASNFENDRLYRERIKTVRTHLLDVASKKSSTSASEQWVTVSEPVFHSVEKNIGMAIAHKDAGFFDYEAQSTPQPPGFAYIATEQQGSNQYGYWSHQQGESLWHWLPEYLILRELLWNHDYRPIGIGEYRGYQMARTAGRTFYGQTTPAAPPKYGTGGTFTASHYAGSRYAQAGGFKGSGYASDRTNRAPPAGGMHAQPQPGAFARSDGAGKRFGSGASAPSGRRFGQSRGFPSAGRAFGRRR